MVVDNILFYLNVSMRYTSSSASIVIKSTKFLVWSRVKSIALVKRRNFGKTLYIYDTYEGSRHQCKLPVYIRSVYEDGYCFFFFVFFFLKYGNTIQKLDEAELDVEFHLECRTYNVFQKFLRFTKTILLTRL